MIDKLSKPDIHSKGEYRYGDNGYGDWLNSLPDKDVLRCTLTKAEEVRDRIIKKSSNKNPAIAHLEGKRPHSRPRSPDSYEDHAKRTAYTAAELLPHPLPLTVAFLHDFFEPEVQQVATNNIRTKFHGDADSILSALTRFQELDSHSQEMAQRIIDEMSFEDREQWDKGTMTPEGYKRLMTSLFRHTNSLIEKNSDKYENPWDMVARLVSDKTAESELAAHIAYLAAARDNLDFPKPGRTEADRMNLGLAVAAHMPVYAALGQEYFALAQEIMVRSFFSEEYEELVRVMTEGEDQYNIEQQAEIADGAVDAIRQHLQANTESELIFLTDEQFWEKVRAKNKIVPSAEKGEFEIISAYDDLLGPNEVYFPKIKKKSQHSILVKALKHWTETGKDKMREDILHHSFGSEEFWKAYLPTTHDTLRTHIVAGANAASYLDTLFQEFQEWKPGEEHEVILDEIDIFAKKVNNARVRFDDTSDEKWKAEVYETDTMGAKGENDQRYQSHHCVLRPPIAGLFYNFELHLVMSYTYLLGEIIPSDIAHEIYKISRYLQPHLKWYTKDEGARENIQLAVDFLHARRNMRELFGADER